MSQPLQNPPGDPVSDAVSAYLNRPKVDPVKAGVVPVLGQDPDYEAKMQGLAKELGIPTLAVKGAPQQAAQQAQVQKMGLDTLSQQFPATAKFLSNQDNAAVAHDDVDNLKAMEITLSDGSRQLIDVGSVHPDQRSAITRFLQEKLLPTLQGFPVTRAAIGTLGGTVGMGGDIASFAGLHGPDSGPNALQRFQRRLDPSVTGADTIMGSRHLPFDTIAQNLGPLLPTLGVGAATSTTARVLGASERTANFLAAGTTGAAFTAQQGGQAFEQALAEGKTPDQARTVADRVALINAPANIGLGALSSAERFRALGPLAPAALGAAQGASAQVGQNYLEGQPLTQNLLGATTQGSAFMLGLHGAFETVGGVQAARDASELARESKLRQRSPDKYAEAVQGAVAGTTAESVRVPVDEFNKVFAQGGKDPEQVANALGATNYAEAKLAGTDVLLPTGEYFAKVAATPEGKALEQHLRFAPEALTESELQTYMQQAPEEQAKLKAEGQKLAEPDARATAVQRIAEDTQGQLEGAGFDPSVARTYAQLHSNAMANLAERSGMDPLELQRRFPLTVSRGGAEEGVPRGTEPAEVAPVERRSVGDRAAQIRDLITKRKAGAITPEEGELLHDLNERERVQAKVGGSDMPGVSNTTAYADARAAGDLKSTQVFADLDDFKRVNDTFGHAAGDDAIHAFGKSLVEHFGEGNVFHRGGDEFVAQHVSPEQADAAMAAVRADMDKFQVKGKDVGSGERRQQTGIGLSYGKGEDVGQAELDQYADKARRKAEGKRVGVREDVAPGVEPTKLEQGPERGYIQFGAGRKFNIGLLDGADLSTFVHETGHLYTELLGDLVKEPKASEQLKADYATLREYAGAKGDAPLTTEQHETLARSLEAYLMEGKAPSEGLRAAFERVKNWMKVIYRSVSALNVNLSDDVRQVFGRIYASDAEIEAAKGRLGADWHVFRSAQEMGVSQKEFEDYVANQNRSDRTAKDALRRVLVGEYQKEQEKAAKTERETLRHEVQDELDARPEYKALKALAEGKTEDGQPLKLSRQAMVDKYGAEAIKALPRRFSRLWTLEGGVDPDAAAEVLGFRSGDDLVRALRDAPSRNDAVKAEVESRFREAHPDPMTDGSLPDRAVEASHNAAREATLMDELRALRRLQATREAAVEAKRAADRGPNAKPPTQAMDARKMLRALPPQEAFKATAREIISETQVRDLDARGYLTAQRKAAREAFVAAAKGDFGAAAEAKQREVLSHHLFLEAQKAKADVEKIVRRATGLQETEAQRRLAKAGGTFREQVNALLDRYEMARVPLDTLAKREALADWADKQREDGFEPDIAPEVLNEARRINYRQAPVGELRAVGDALKNITHVARQQLEMVVNGRKVAFEAVKESLKASARAVDTTKGEPLSGTEKTILNRIGDGLVGADAMLVKMERVFRDLDGGKIGPWSDNLFRPIAEGQTRFYELNRDVTMKLRETMKGLPKEVKNGLADRFEVDGFDQPINRRQLLTMAMNQGNAENQRVLREGYGLSQQQVDRAMHNLSRPEAEFVAKAWQVLETLREPAGDLQRRMTGLEPKWVDTQRYTFRTKDGDVQTEGGYFPLVADRDRTTVGPKVSADALLEKEYVRATTSQGYLKERTGATYPLLLDFQRILSSHVLGVVKDLSYREAATSINKIMSDQTVREAVDGAVGRSYRKQIEPWLRNVLNDSNDSTVKGLRDFSTWVNATRRNVSAATIGFRITSMLTIPTDLFRAWEPGRSMESTTTRVDTRHLAAGFKDFLSNPVQATKWVREASGEMRFRPHNIDRDVRSLFQQQLVRPALTGNPLDAATAFRNYVTTRAYEGFAFVDTMVTIPTWLGAYRQAMEAGLPHDKAVFQADATVRLSIVSENPKDLVALQRNNDLSKLLTMFNGWGFSTYDLMRTLGRDVKGPGTAAKAAFYGLLGVSVSNMAAAYLAGRGPDKGENVGEWAAREAVLGPFDVIPVVRDFADYGVGQLTGRGGDMRFSPVLTMMEKEGKALVAQGKALQGDEDIGDYLTVTGEALGYLMGIPGTAQATSMTKYLRRLASGDEQPDNAAVAVLDAARGKPKGK